MGQAVGWELDAMKVRMSALSRPPAGLTLNVHAQFLSGLQLGYDLLPRKKWYLLLDDDTYLIKPSLQLVLGHVDSSKPTYLGNAIGDYKARFAHGGSSFLVSHAAMGRLLDRNSAVLAEGYRSSLTEIWGDKLVATTLMKVGVFVDERFSRFFNGERPLITKILADRFCSPLVSFHGLAEPVQMRDVGRIFGAVDRPVRWSELWTIYGQPGLDVFKASPIRPGKDYVGVRVNFRNTSLVACKLADFYISKRVDENSMTQSCESAERCFEMCEKQKSRSCMAWTWDKERKACHISPWVIVGSPTSEGKYSGLNLALMERLLRSCD